MSSRILLCIILFFPSVAEARSLWERMADYVEAYKEGTLDGEDADGQFYCIDYYHPEPYCTDWKWYDDEFICVKLAFPSSVCVDWRYR